MKIIVVYASAGTGHLKAAEAIYNYLKKEYSGIDLKLIDILDKVHPLFRLSYASGYSYLVKYIPLFWLLAFWVTYTPLLRFIVRPIATFLNKINTITFTRALIKENPDCIISTHFLPSVIVTDLKKSKKINPKLFTIITDFKVHPFWVTVGTDIYVVASSFTRRLLVSKGIKEDRIREFGIPIHPKFLEEYDRRFLCTKLGINQNRFTVLIITGSHGIGPIEESVDLLFKDVQILVVCAKNKKLYLKLKDKNYPGVKVFSFVNNIQELMVVSNIIVTKPGGLSIAELLAMELVPIFISPIPGQETANIEVLQSYGVGIEAKDAKDLKNIVSDYKEHPEKIDSIKERIRGIKKPFATEDLCNEVCQGSSWPGS